MKINVEESVRQLSEGTGFLRFEAFFSSRQVTQARELIYSLAENEPARASHFHGDETPTTQKRVWNLIEKGEIFRTLAADPQVLAILQPLLGEDLMLSSIAANVLYQGAPAQEPHVDYPYWDLHARARWPRTLNASFFLAVETILMLDEFTEENGATSIVPESQKLCRWPDSHAFSEKSIRVTGPPGTLLIFPALMWHAGRANETPQPRAAILSSYTCKSIKPIEDWSRCLSSETVEKCDERMRSLLGLDYPYPAVMDQLPARSSEGTRSQEKLTASAQDAYV